jgi:phenylpropionate dioxygenase-like ring-hydroxylating dioxygenase large terminal subunit
MNQWQPIAHVSELRNHGDYVCLPWGGDHEVAVTNFHGAIVAWNNRCPHRGARIYTDMFGNAEPKCAYHARVAKVDQVKRCASTIFNDWVWVSHQDVWSDAPRMLFDAGRFPSLSLYRSVTFIQQAHWTVSVENALDFEHVGAVHESSLHTLGLNSMVLNLFPNGGSMERFKSNESRRLAGLGAMFAHDLPDWDYAHVHYFPYTCMSSTKGLTVSLQQYFPRADGTTTFVHRMYQAQTKQDVRSFFASAWAMNLKIFDEDRKVVELVRPWHNGPLEEHEARIKHFREHLA